MKLPRLRPSPVLGSSATPHALREGGSASGLERVAPSASVLPAAKKTAILGYSRPSFTGTAGSTSCPKKNSQNQSLDHLIPWASIRNGYYAAMNPSSSNSCSNNLGLLYDSVGLARDSTAISNACASSNVNNNSVTSTDSAILKALNSSMSNLRCGYSSANQSVSNALDIPCSDQSYNSSSSRIEISGTSAQRLSAYMAIGSTVPQPPFLYKTNQSCNGGGTCNNKRAQTSDCSNDVGAQAMPSSTAPAYYYDGYQSKYVLL